MVVKLKMETQGSTESKTFMIILASKRIVINVSNFFKINSNVVITILFTDYRTINHTDWCFSNWDLQK